MKNKKLIWLILLMPLAFVSLTSGQNVREVLTNAHIIDLVRSGFSEQLIVEKIHQSECKCDTSSAGMQKLKTAKVTDAVILAMMDSSRGYSDSVSIVGKSKNTNNDLPEKKTLDEPVAGPKELKQITEPGIYLFENGKMNQIEPSVFSGSSVNPLKASLTFGIKKIKFKAKVRGRSANLNTTSSQPVFYFVFSQEYKNAGAAMSGFWGYATSPAEFLMVQMDVQSNSRQAVMGEVSAFTGSTSMGARDKDVREYSFEKVKPGTYRVVPKTNLAPGEYSFYYAGTITGYGFAGGKVFDFGVK